MDINISYYTAKGRRSNNEDSVSLLENDNSLLAIVADGLGGHDDGEVASQQAVTTMNTLLQSKSPDEAKLIDAIQQASRDIFDRQDGHHPMHTTVASLWVGDHCAIAANVGDSRIYQFRNGEIIYQSLDHSVAQMAVLVGELHPSEIRQSTDRNKLIRVLGDSDVPKVDCKVLYIQEGDRFLLCSDGFWEAVTEEDMLMLINRTSTAKEWLSFMRKIVEKAANPRQDNHTAVALIINKTI